MSSCVERRTLEAAGLRVHESIGDTPSPVITGHAAVFDQWAVVYRGPNSKGQMMEVREIIRPGAFRNAIIRGDDVRALIDHNPTLILGRTRSGSLLLSEDDEGLAVLIKPPDTQAARDIRVNIDRGDVSQMSFAYLPGPKGIETTKRIDDGVIVIEQVVVDVVLYDVSIVTYPAYRGTDVAIRTRAVGRAEKVESMIRIGAELDRLAKLLPDPSPSSS